MRSYNTIVDFSYGHKCYNSVNTTEKFFQPIKVAEKFLAKQTKSVHKINGFEVFILTPRNIKLGSQNCALPIHYCWQYA